MAGSFLNTQYREVRPARAEQLPDGRKRLTRFVSFKQNSEFPAEMGGTVATSTDAASNWSSPPTGWENLYLISAATDTSLSPNGSGNNPVTILTYESAGTIAQTDETKNNGALLIRTIRTAHTAPATPSGYTLIQTVDDNPSGFDTFTYTFAKGTGEIGQDVSYRQSSDQGTTGVTVTTIRYIVADEGTVQPTTLSGSVKVGEDYTDQDGYRIWTTTWAKGTGTVVTSTEIKNGGALYIYRKVALGSAPTAPTASTGGTVTEIGSSERQDSGYTIYEKTWAEGEGEINRNIDYRQSDNTGTTGVTITTIRHLTATSVSTDPTSAPAGTVKISEDKSDQDGYRVWTVVYAKGTGEVASRIRARQDGLREETIVSLGSRVAPVGVVIEDESRLVDGYTVYTVTAMQNADGTASVTSVSMAFERYVPFTYPGRAKAFTETYDGKTMLNLFESPPVSTLVKATVTVTYTTTNTLVSITDFWNPTEWATVRSQWTGSYGRASSELRALPGYRSVSSTPVTVTGSGFDATIYGHNVYAGTDAKITVTGGPADPGGNDYTLSAELEPAFISTAGTVYYRKTLVTASIPAQTALPV